jgi:hypothetical protein
VVSFGIMRGDGGLALRVEDGVVCLVRLTTTFDE